MWIWVKRIQALKGKKIRWENVTDKGRLEIFSLSTDGVDCPIREPSHPTLPRDNKACSHKMNGAAAKYEVTLLTQAAKCVHIAGPFKGGVHDLEMFREGGLKEKLIKLNRTVRGIRHVKLCLADRGYRSKDENENGLFSLPNGFNSPELHRFKSRGRLRHETFNARLK